MKTKLTIGIIGVALLIACSDEELSFNTFSNHDVGNSAIECVYSNVSVNQLKSISDIFWNGEMTSRSVGVEKKIKNIKAVNGKDNVPLIYIINYIDNGGYILMSATQNFHPILSYANEGNLDYAQAPEHVKNWINGYINQIEACNSSDSIREFRKEWLKYNMMTQRAQKKSRAASTSEYEIYDSIATAYILYWEENNIGVMNLWAVDDIIGMWSPGLPEDVLEEWIFKARTWYSLPGTEDMEFDYVLVEDISSIEKKILPVHTKWHQESPFNHGLIDGIADNNQPLVGCGPVAIGQVMKYYEWPNTYNWELMDNELATNESRKLLKDIVKKGNVSFEGGGGAMNIKESRNVLGSYGYSASLKESHDPALVYNSLKNGNLVIMRGKDAQKGTGHQWICHGYELRTPIYKFTVMALSKDRNGKIIMEDIGSYLNKDHKTHYSFYMEWGAPNGGFNGMYLDQNLGLNTSEGYKDYCKDRMNIINIKPNK